MVCDPTVLAFDTSAAHGACGLLRGDAVLAWRAEPMAKGQAERLFPLLEDTLGDAGMGWPDITHIAVASGPGNFTGIRIAVAAARGLALSLSVPAIGISGFDVAAFGHSAPLTITINAPRDQFYVQHRATPNDRPAPQICPAKDLISHGAVVALETIPLHERLRRLALLASTTSDGLSPPVPIYVRPADAAPPRDAPPTILPDLPRA